MRGPILNMSPGLGASGVDIEYRRNSQGMRGTLSNENSIVRVCLRFSFLLFLSRCTGLIRQQSLEIVFRYRMSWGKLRKLLLSATNQLPLSSVQIQPSPPYYRQPSQDDGRKVSNCFAFMMADKMTFQCQYICISVE